MRVIKINFSLNEDSYKDKIFRTYEELSPK